MDIQNAQPKCRIKHTNYRITNFDQTIKFYSEAFGMKLLARVDIDERRMSLIFLGYGDIESTTTLELTYSWDPKPLQMGDSYRHICIGSSDIQNTFDNAIKAGATVIHEPFKPAYADVHIAFVKDLDGYAIEIMQDM